jgi:hypothetical protein
MLRENRSIRRSFIDEHGDVARDVLAWPERWKTLHSTRYLAAILPCILIVLAKPIAARAQTENAPISMSSETSVREKVFMHENRNAMEQMMSSMDVKSTGDVDRDFVAMMAAHHQGAIAMAKSLLVYGKNERLKRIAQEIIVTQQEEINAMHLAIGGEISADDAYPTGQKPGMGH